MNDKPNKLPSETFDLRDMTAITYSIYGILALAMVAQFNLYTFLPGSVAVICAVVYAYIKRKELKDTIFESHYQWMTRTFWIGGAVYLPIATIVLSVYQLFMMDMTPVFGAMREGDHDVQSLMGMLYENNNQMIFRSSVTVLGIFAAWWWWRCLRGVWQLRKGEPLPRVMSWF